MLRICGANYVYLHHEPINSIMATVQAFIRISTKNIDRANIRFRLRDGRNIQLFHKSELEINPSVWDSEKQAIKAKVLYKEVDRAKFNKSIADRKDLILQVYNAEINKAGLTSDWLELSINKALRPEQYKPIDEKPKTVLQYIETFISTAHTRKDKATGRLLVYNNIQQYKATEKHLKAFAASKRKKDFEFNHIDQNFYNGFVDYLQNSIPALDKENKPLLYEDGTPKLLKECFTQNSVGKHIKILKVILNEATREGVNTSTAYNQFFVFTEDSDAVYLNETELQQLKNKTFSDSPHLENVRDWFLLLAWTGARFSDLEKISQTDIKDGFITFRQKKTNTKVTIPLHPVVSEILQKHNYKMPEPISNQKFNEYIKEVAEMAGMTSPEVLTRTVGGTLKSETMPKFELISSHTGRRSFCTNMYKRGLPTLMIMSISGHRTEKSFLKYIRVKQQEHAELMAEKWKEMYK